MPIAPDRPQLRSASWYSGVRGTDAERLEPVGRDRWMGILILLSLLIAGLLLALMFV